ncbi:MAG: hypothetical protein HY255_12760 [Betaproteobacteria bacterium]|nr:hypothetical protein [Betaproteobacteria bacterium]
MVTKSILRFGAMAAAALLASCAFDQGVKSAATAPQLVEASGPPQLKLPLAGGGERWFYTTAPAGTQTWRIDVDASGAVTAREQVLTDGMFQDIHSGLSADEIRQRIGPPFRKVRFERTQTTAWDYFYRDTYGYYAFFSVIFTDDGIVSSKFIQRREPSDNNK